MNFEHLENEHDPFVHFFYRSRDEKKVRGSARRFRFRDKVVEFGFTQISTLASRSLRHIQNLSGEQEAEQKVVPESLADLRV